ncbi:hypothetical protein J6590_061667 [Homalodisca vitripennis]|nr:hypothetical protein J6590_061667 [Homalodisca vitripennis]
MVSKAPISLSSTSINPETVPNDALSQQGTFYIFDETAGSRNDHVSRFRSFPLTDRRDEADLFVMSGLYYS